MQRYFSVRKVKPAIGRWVLGKSLGGAELVQTVSTGWSSGVTESTRQSEIESLALAVSAGFSYGSFGASVDVTGTYSQLLETSTSNSLATYRSEEF